MIKSKFKEHSNISLILQLRLIGLWLKRIFLVSYEQAIKEQSYIETALFIRKDRYLMTLKPYVVEYLNVTYSMVVEK